MSIEHAANGHGQATDAATNGHGHGHEDHIHPEPTNPLLKYVFSSDHKIIGIQFLFSGLIFFVLGGLLAMAIRWQMAWPWKPMPILGRLNPAFAPKGGLLPPLWYTHLITKHG